MTDLLAGSDKRPLLKVDVVEAGIDSMPGFVRCEIGADVKFETSRMEAFFFSKWKPVHNDVLLVAAAVEFSDMALRRPTQDWGRRFILRIPGHDPKFWLQDDVFWSLRDALQFLTNDRWEIHFYARKESAGSLRQDDLNFDRNILAVIPYSDGLDSYAVARLEAQELGDRVVRVRLGKKKFELNGISQDKEPFTVLPYHVRRHNKSYSESSARSRGFKFAVVSGIAAHLAEAEKIVIPESGQGALGPSLIPVGHIHPDYRSHPFFGRKMEAFLDPVLGLKARFFYPYIWNTKAETLARSIESSDDGGNWAKTRSCWQGSRYASVKRKLRQCGVCAACMLRRQSVHAAGLEESRQAFVWENLASPTYDDGASSDFDISRNYKAMSRHAIAGTLHLDHLASVAESQADSSGLSPQLSKLCKSLDLPVAEVKMKLKRMLARHKSEWGEFLKALGPESFVVKWIMGGNHERI